MRRLAVAKVDQTSKTIHVMRLGRRNASSRIDELRAARLSKMQLQMAGRRRAARLEAIRPPPAKMMRSRNLPPRKRSNSGKETLSRVKTSKPNRRAQLGRLARTRPPVSLKRAETISQRTRSQTVSKLWAQCPCSHITPSRPPVQIRLQRVKSPKGKSRAPNKEEASANELLLAKLGRKVAAKPTLRAETTKNSLHLTLNSEISVKHLLKDPETCIPLIFAVIHQFLTQS